MAGETTKVRRDAVREYWEERLKRGDITSVGRLGLSKRMNESLHRLTTHSVDGLMQTHRILPFARALDVGTGWGAWVDYWHAAGVQRVDATDFADEAITRIRERWPDGGDYLVADLTAPGSLRSLGTFPLVSCMNVLLHVLDREGFQLALSNLAAAVAPDGYLLLAEPALVARNRRNTGRDGVSLSRPLEEFAFSDLDLVDVRAAAAIAGDPIDAIHPAAMLALRIWWWGVIAADKVGPARELVARVVEGSDQIARWAGWSTTGKLLLFQRAAASNSGSP